MSFREEKLTGFQLSVWPWAPINLAVVTRSPCIGDNTSDWDKKGRRAVERGGDWRFWKASSMSAGLEVAYSALSAQASYSKERQNQFSRLQKGETLARVPQETKEVRKRGWEIHPPLEDGRRPYTSLHCGSCSLLSFWKFLTAHTFMDILTLFFHNCANAYTPSYSESIPTHHASGPRVEKH